MKITTQNIIRLLLVLLMLAGGPRWGSVACAQSLSGSGTEDDPYLINSADDWLRFVSDIENGGRPGGYNYNGKFVKLTADIEIGNRTVMFNDFRGTLDGDGHTMIVALSNYAIFKVTNSATIKNLRVSGTVNYSNKFAGSFIEECSGTTTIENCISVATIISTISGDASSGGFVGKVDPYATLTIKNCLFQGKLLGSDATDCGGFVGTGTHETSECIVQNSFFNPSEITIRPTGSRTISRCKNNLTIANCYYTRVFGEAQGESVAIMSNSEILSGLGDSWTQQDNHFYLKAFCKNVQIKGWVVGGTANAPYFENNHGILSSEQYPIYYKGKDNDQYTTTVPSAVGMYTVKTKIYDSWESTKNFWIVNPPTAIEGLTYNGLDQPLLSASETTTAAGTYYYRLGEDGEWSPSIPTAKDKGTYTVYYYVKSNNPSDYSDIGSETAYAGSVSVTIGPKSDGLTISAEDCTYNGIAQTPAVTVKDGDTVVDPSEYTVSSYTNNVLAGTGSVTVKDNPGGNYTVSGTATFTINRKVLAKPAIKLSPTTMTYTGSALKPEVTVYDSEDEIDESEYSVSYSDNTNVGTAKVTVSDKENGNYSITTTVATFTVNKAQLGSTAPKAKSLTYNGTAQELVTAGTVSGAGDVSGCTMMYSTDGSNYSASVPTGTDAKTYTVYYKVMGDSNHKDILASSITVTIGAKKLFTSAISISQTSYSYDGKAKEPTVTVKDGDTDVSSSEYTVSYSDNTDVGTATVTVTDNPGGNYEVSGSVQFTITSGDATYTPPSAKQRLTYNKKDQELVDVGRATNGVMKYSLDNQTYSTTIPTGKDAKDYIVYFKVTGDPNHADMAAQTIMVTISPKTVSSPKISVVPSSLVYDGTEQKPTVIVKDGRDEIDESEYTVNYVDNIKIGTAAITITDNEGGNYTVSGSATFKIVDALEFEVVPEAKSGLVYNGKSQELVTPGVAPEGTMLYSLDGMNYNIDIPTGMDAGKYIVYYKVVDENGVTKGSTSTITVTISPKEVSCNVIVTGRGQFLAPSVEVIDENDQLLEPDGYEVVFRNTDEDEVIPDAYGRMEAGFYRVIVTPTGNYAGPSVSTTFRIRGELSFKFEMHSDVITICLPFTRSLPGDYEAYRFDHIDMDNMPVFEQVKTKQLQAGEPYVLKYVGTKSSTRATTRILDLSPSSPALVDLSTPLREQQNGNLSFLGTFDDLSNQKARTLGAYILHSNNSWRASASAKAGDDHKTYLEAFHAYMVYRNHSTPEEELSVLIPGVIVGIDKIILEDEAGEQRWYDLNGRRIDKPQKGVNILRTASGKTRKVVIK